MDQAKDIRYCDYITKMVDAWASVCEVQIDADKKRLWVNLPNGCVLRVVAEHEIEIKDYRTPELPPG